MTSEPSKTQPGISTPLTLVFAFCGGAAVANLYWAQPLLTDLGRDLGVDPGLSGLLVTFTQAGYALGVFLLVPLGDVVSRRRLLPLLTAVAAAALVLCALAPAFGVLLATLALVGVSSVAGQLLTPLAGDLARDDQRGRAVSTVAAGILLGILASRAISGFVADLVGWRGVFVVAAILTVGSAVLLARFVPELPRREHVPYPQLLTSVLTALGRYRTPRPLIVIGFCVMAVFTMFWTGLTFLLAAEPFRLSLTQIGLVSLVGIGGAVAAQRVGRLYDRGLAAPTIAIGLGLTLASIVVTALAQASLLVIVLAVAVLSVGIQASMVLLQTTMITIDPAARSRLNTVFVVGNFIGGAIGSAIAGAAWSTGGWTLLAGIAAALLAVALVVHWVADRAASTARPSAAAGPDGGGS